MKRKGILRALPILFVLTIVSAVIVLLNWYFQNKEVVIISHDSGIYMESFQLSVNTLQPATIYYTLDGSVPDASSKSTYVYSEPIDIEEAPYTYEETDILIEKDEREPSLASDEISAEEFMALVEEAL